MQLQAIQPEHIRGMRLILLGLTILFLSFKYDRYLQTNRCPHCRGEVPDEADICPYCYKSLLQYEGITCGQTLIVAFMLMLGLVISAVVLIPFEALLN